jgi:dTMP kinase
MLIVIEGLDGSGKSTQVRKLKKYLEGKNDKFEYIHFPRYEAPVYGDLISSFLRGDFGSMNEVHRSWWRSFMQRIVMELHLP